MVAIHKIRGIVRLYKFNCIEVVILEKAKLFMFQALYDHFEKELDCFYDFTDTDSIFLMILMVVLLSRRWIKIKATLSNTELGKMKDEITYDTTIESCFFKAKAYCYTTFRGEEEENLKKITKATIEIQIFMRL